MDFAKRYANLNTAQKLAVDTIEGPVMVIAGPGTGKTELLSVRVANILKQTDTLPENILCLTFTDSGAVAMRERLTSIIGKDAYKVAVHTFHSFGTEVINQNSEYFYKGSIYKPADQLSSHEILQSIFDKLPHNNPLASKNYDEYTYLYDTFRAISEIKKSGLDSADLISILDKNDIAINKIENILSPVFESKISKGTVSELRSKLSLISEINEIIDVPSIVPLSKIISDSLETAIIESEESGKTTAVTAWKNNYFEKDTNGKQVPKSKKRAEKLRAVCLVYDKYIEQMHHEKLFDFDDMILEVVHKIEENNDLKFNLQEKYQYILVDEFQDTNLAQMRILHNLTDNEVNYGSPNIMVVGDDDQAIYSFQGADVSNIIDFRNNFPTAKVITLTDNYRSTETILDVSRKVIIQGHDRLENVFEDINKQLVAHSVSVKSKVDFIESETSSDERFLIASDIKKRIIGGEKPSNIAVLTRQHSEINELLPYIYKQGIAVNYERHDNILEQPIIIYIEKLSRLILNISKSKFSEVNVALPDILSHPAWGINPIDICKLSIKSYSNHCLWIETMQSDTAFVNIHKWLVNTAAKVPNTPLEQILDIIIGNPEKNGEDFSSPLYDYYFSKENLEKNPEEYLLYLDSLRTLRSKVKEYKPNDTPTLELFIDYMAKNRQINATINSSRKVTNSENAINIMTAHKSKGLEFNRVYIINAIDNVWGGSKHKRGKLINYPENLQISPAGETDDERLRLFYVAMTRAKQNLTVSYSRENDSEKNTMCAAFLTENEWSLEKNSVADETNLAITASEIAWYSDIINPVKSDIKELLKSTLENYKLSVTHFHNFLDITRGGPESFLMQSLLRFPQSKSANAGFGTAIHDTLQQSHAYFMANKKQMPVNEISKYFTLQLTNQYLAPDDYNRFLQKGIDALTIFFNEKNEFFNENQKTELNFSNQNSMVDDAHLTGKLDLADIDKTAREIIVTDYKTGAAADSWNGKSDHEKIKLHKYKQQLMFYKLLVENSRDFQNFNVESGILQFVEPTKDGRIVSLQDGFNQSELDEFKKLVSAVWKKIINLDLPDISSYESNFKGILAFEQDLINEAA